MRNTSGQVMGVEPNYSEVRFLPMAEGRFLDATDLAERQPRSGAGIEERHAAVLGRPMLGETITINDIAFTVVGRAEPVSHGNNEGDNQKIYIPLYHDAGTVRDEGRQRCPRRADLHPVPAGDKEETVTAAVAAVHRVIAERHGFDPSLKDAFEEWNTIQTQKMISAIFNAMDIFLGGVGIVTLGLGAVGIINIMLVSVTERTREIGVMKAVGATKSSILAQFFWEGLLLTGISGLIGIAVSAGFMGLLQAVLTGKMPGWDPPRLVPWSAALAVGSLAVCGVVAGLYPASKAAALDPIEALRREERIALARSCNAERHSGAGLGGDDRQLAPHRHHHDRHGLGHRHGGVAAGLRRRFQQSHRGHLCAMGHEHYRLLSRPHQPAGRRRQGRRAGALYPRRCGPRRRQRSRHLPYLAGRVAECHRPERSAHLHLGGRRRAPVFQDICKLDTDAGRFFNGEEEQQRAHVCVIGSEAKTKLFSGGWAVGENIRLNGENFTVVGVLKPKMQEGDDDNAIA